MRGPVSAACVFSVLMAAVCSLKCVQYTNVNPGDSFNENFGQVVDCPSENDVCLMVFFVMQQRSENKQLGFQYLRHCGWSSRCDRKESLTTASYHIRYSTTCCRTDACLPALPVLPKENFVKNGVICPTCLSSKEKQCIPERAMECTGDETHCIFFNETMFKDFNLHSYGCGTKNIFKENGAIVSLLTFYSTITVTETKPFPGLKIGNFLWCHVCHEENAAICSKVQTLCKPDNDVCVSERRRIIDEQSRKLTMQIRRRCGKSSECQFTGTITSREKTLSIRTSCCDTDMCNTPEPIWPLKRRKNNGRKCPSCFPTDNSNCHATDVVHCNGDETHCVHYWTNLTEDAFSVLDAYHGCSSAGICEHETAERFEIPEYKTAITTRLLCSGGVRAISQLLSIIIIIIAKSALWSLSQI